MTTIRFFENVVPLIQENRDFYICQSNGSGKRIHCWKGKETGGRLYEVCTSDGSILDGPVFCTSPIDILAVITDFYFQDKDHVIIR